MEEGWEKVHKPRFTFLTSLSGSLELHSNSLFPLSPSPASLYLLITPLCLLLDQGVVSKPLEAGRAQISDKKKQEGLQATLEPGKSDL